MQDSKAKSSASSNHELENSLETFRAWQSGEPWAQCLRVLTGLRAQCLERAARASNQEQWNVWRGWVFCLDHILSGSLSIQAREVLGLEADEVLDTKPMEDYIRREGVEENG